jgi:Flp pilus assembly protein TadG
MFRVQHKVFRILGRPRKGAAVVELAVCLPVMILLTFGSIELTNVIFLKQVLKTAAYEGARTATAPGKDGTAATTASNNVLTSRGISGGSVTVSPAVTTSTATGTNITVSVTAPIGSNTYMKQFLLGQVVTKISGSVTMTRQ